MSHGKALINDLIAGLIKKTMQNEYIKMNQYFSKRYEPFRGNISGIVYLSNYATKADFKKMQEELILLY